MVSVCNDDLALQLVFARLGGLKIISLLLDHSLKEIALFAVTGLAALVSTPAHRESGAGATEMNDAITQLHNLALDIMDHDAMAHKLVSLLEHNLPSGKVHTNYMTINFSGFLS